MLIALGIDLVIVSVILYCFGKASQDLGNGYDTYFMPAALITLLLSPWFIVFGVR